VDGDAAAAEQIREGVVLLAGSFGPEHIVEEELVDVAGRQPLQLETGTVQDDLPQHPDLGPHSEGRTHTRTHRVAHRPSLPARWAAVTCKVIDDCLRHGAGVIRGGSVSA
jgi:hypothetical protein